MDSSLQDLVSITYQTSKSDTSDPYTWSIENIEEKSIIPTVLVTRGYDSVMTDTPTSLSPYDNDVKKYKLFLISEDELTFSNICGRTVA